MISLIDTNLIIRFLLWPGKPGFKEAETEIKAGYGTLPCRSDRRRKSQKSILNNNRIIADILSL